MQKKIAKNHQPVLFALVNELIKQEKLSKTDLYNLQKKYLPSSGDFFSKTEILAAVNKMIQQNPDLKVSPAILKALQMKPTRTMSGVAPVTVLTKPYPCPGNCLFCPSDIRMPKSYLASEPGAQRAEKHFFDPYLQTFSRIQTLADMGHAVDKIELIVLGGTWSNYPEDYQIWFIKRCFDAMNDFGYNDDRAKITKKYLQALAKLKDQKLRFFSNDPVENKKNLADLQTNLELKERPYNQLVQNFFQQFEKLAGIDKWQSASFEDLIIAQEHNETSLCRSVGLVLETRPDCITEAEIVHLRKLGATKIQLGIQSTTEEILIQNRRGHSSSDSKKAISLLRLAGFKIHLHWMANLYGSNVMKDKLDFDNLFKIKAYRPDELKVYPCSLIKSADLYELYQQGLWQPYTESELLDLLVHIYKITPIYCRITRMLRDIPSFEIVTGNKKSNFRQLVEKEIQARKLEIWEIRSREIRAEKFDPEKVFLKVFQYKTTVSQEYFLFITTPVTTKNTAEAVEKLLGFLRLSLPLKKNFLEELSRSALIREVHVYGHVQALGETKSKQAQHLGFGKELIGEAVKIAGEHQYQDLAVISAVGTRKYYEKLGFTQGELYQHLALV